MYSLVKPSTQKRIPFMESPVNKEILLEYFSGRATPLQKRMIEEWLQQPDNEYYFYQCLDQWEKKYPQYLPDTEKALAAYEHLMDHPTEKPLVRRSTISNPFLPRIEIRWLAVAMISSLLVVAGLMAGKEYWFYRTYVTVPGETRTFTLTDNSRVTLNVNSSLKVARTWFFNPEREVWLKGEAFFNVSKDPERRQFIVHTSTMQIEVLGTKFNVVNRRRKTKVVLQEGKVKILPNSFPQTKSLVMQPGDYVEHAAGANKITRKVVKPLKYTAWQEKKLIFERTPLHEVLETVEDYYGVRVELKDSMLATKAYTGILPINNLEVIIRSLSSIYQLEASQDNNRITLQ